MTKKTWSFWERDLIPQKHDLIIVGAGFTGLSVALHAKQLHPEWSILILERSIYPEGASTKNAGFACYGTLGEILSDIDIMGKEIAFDLVRQRLQGLDFLKALIGGDAMDFKVLGGTEVFLKGEEEAWNLAQSNRKSINEAFNDLCPNQPLFIEKKVPSSFKDIIGSVYSPLEAQLHPLKALERLLRLARESGISILNGVEVKGQELFKDGWRLNTGYGYWQSKKVVFASNAFGVPNLDMDIIPARNQVLITKPFNHGIPQGNYHAQEGYIYFRTVKDRILIGGARHLDAQKETTEKLGVNSFLQSRLLRFLDQELNLKGRYEIGHQWSGIIAIGRSKEPLIKMLAPDLWYCGRFGGMGVALSAITGKRAADLLDRN